MVTLHSPLKSSGIVPLKRGRTRLSLGNPNTAAACQYCFPLPPRKPADLQNLAPGTNPPFMTFDGEVKMDVNKIEEFLEEKLAPPR